MFAFVRAGDEAARKLALSLGAEWAGDAAGPAPEPLDAALIFAPAGELVPAALRACAPGGAVVCAGIHMSDIPSFPYELLWHERSVRSVANLTRADGREFLALAPQVPVRTRVTEYPLPRAGDEAARELALSLGAEWAGDAAGSAPEPLDAALIFAPAGELVPAALAACAPGGVVVCAGIHMSDIPAFPYELLWQERVLRSVANLTRADAREFLALAPRVPVRTTVTAFALEDAEEALAALRAGRIEGSAVISVAG